MKVITPMLILVANGVLVVLAAAGQIGPVSSGGFLFAASLWLLSFFAIDADRITFRVVKPAIGVSTLGCSGLGLAINFWAFVESASV